VIEEAFPGGMGFRKSTERLRPSCRKLRSLPEASFTLQIEAHGGEVDSRLEINPDIRRQEVCGREEFRRDGVLRYREPRRC
jgi:hypothetical protein